MQKNLRPPERVQGDRGQISGIRDSGRDRRRAGGKTGFLTGNQAGKRRFRPGRY